VGGEQAADSHSAGGPGGWFGRITGKGTQAMTAPTAKHECYIGTQASTEDFEALQDVGNMTAACQKV
jgi:hypothetical protein